jgi:hypothetical protein
MFLSLTLATLIKRKWVKCRIQTSIAGNIEGDNRENNCKGKQE